MAAAAILDFQIHFRFSGFWTDSLRVTSPENFVKIAKAVQQLLHSYFCFVYNGNSLFPRKFWGLFDANDPQNVNRLQISHRKVRLRTRPRHMSPYWWKSVEFQGAKKPEKRWKHSKSVYFTILRRRLLWADFDQIGTGLSCRRHNQMCLFLYWSVHWYASHRRSKFGITSPI